MTEREQGFLLLTGYLGDPERKPLTIPQFRKLTKYGRAMERPDREGDITIEDLMGIGCDQVLARKTIHLLSQEEQLEWYLRKGKNAGCTPITRISAAYPGRLRSVLDLEAPGSLWLKGNMQLLKNPGISVVGSRELKESNAEFATELGRQAALQGYTLISGNARGADKTAQESCLAYGGTVICVVADELEKQPLRENVLYISEEGFDLPFSAQRALQRNRIIHSMSKLTFVIQCGMGKGGTWNGTCNNLRNNLSQVICFADGSDAAGELECRGATLTTTEKLRDLAAFQPKLLSFIDG